MKTQTNTSLRALPYQPPQWISYLVAGRLLHLSILIFVLESYIYFIFLEKAWISGNIIFIGYWVFMTLFAFSHIFLVAADAWSRFQNYKWAKDLLFTYGFNKRIAKRYLGSKCQRLAFETAAKELGYEKETKQYFSESGYKWYHYIPDFMIKDPLFLFKRYFWKRTFLEKHYKPRFDYIAIYKTQHLNDLSPEPVQAI